MSQSVLHDTNTMIRRVYDQIHCLAHRQMRQENPEHTLSATALVNEVYLRLCHDSSRIWQDERHFLGVAASEMRRILIDSARRRNTRKRGKEWKRNGDVAAAAQSTEDPVSHFLIDLTLVLDDLAKAHPQKAELVRIRYLLGYSEVDAAAALGISRATASRHWAFARAWLLDRLKSSEHQIRAIA